MIKVVEFKGQISPAYVTSGNHARYILPIAQEVCKGEGLDIGCNRQEWTFPGAKGIDAKFNDGFHAYNLPDSINGGYDFIFSSHTLEHLPDYVKALDYWTSKVKIGGVLFLYLPHPDSKYWRPWEMPTRRHIHQFSPEQMKEIFDSMNYKKVFFSERDLAQSFAIFGERTS